MRQLFLRRPAAIRAYLFIWICACVGSVPAQAATTQTVAADTTAAQLNAAIAAADPGTVFTLLADTTYEFDQTIHLRSDITLRGAGHTSVIRAAHSQSAIVQAVAPVGGLSNITVENLTLDGGHPDHANLYGFQAWGESGSIQNIRLSGLMIRDIADNTTSGGGGLADPNQFGIFFTDRVTDSVIENNTIENINTQSIWAAGIRVANESSRNTIAGNTIDRTGRGGILTNDRSTDLVIVGNTVSKSGLAEGSADDLGIELFNGNDNSVVENNTVDSWVSVDSSDRVAVRGNTVTGDPQRDNAFFGLEIVDSQDVVFAQNIVQGGVDLGLSVSGSDTTQNVLVFNNDLTNASDFGVQLQGEAGGAREVYLAQNLIDGTDNPDDPGVGDGVRLNENLANIVFDRNTITNNTRFDIAVNGDLATYDNLDLVANRFDDGAGDVEDPGLFERFDANEKPAAEPIEVVAGQTLTFVFDQLAATAADGQANTARVLWDLGAGVPIVEQGSVTQSFSIETPDGLEVGTTLAAVAWDAAGNADFRTAVVVIPEPALAGWAVLVGVSGFVTRPRRR